MSVTEKAGGGDDSDGAATQELPRVCIDEDTPDAPLVIAGPSTPSLLPALPRQGTTPRRSLGPGSRPEEAEEAQDGPEAGPGTGPGAGRPGETQDGPDARPEDGAEPGPQDGDDPVAGHLDQPEDSEDSEGREDHKKRSWARRRRSGRVRHAYHTGRWRKLGLVLVPLRVLLGSVSIYAGMAKLCDSRYLDGGRHGSLVTWLSTLHPGAGGSSLHGFALDHPVVSGLTVAFLQLIVGALTILGLWQRLAAGIGVLLTAVLLLMVSWQPVPDYGASVIFSLAAWSVLLLAGAPLYSLDARLAGEAWRRLGPYAVPREHRRRVLRRGTIMAMAVTGLTLLIGSVVGGVAQSSGTPAPEPKDTSRDDSTDSPPSQPSGADQLSAGPTPSNPLLQPAQSAGSPASSSAPSASTSPSAVRESKTSGSGGSSTSGGGSDTPRASTSPTATPSPTPSVDPSGSTSGGNGGNGGNGNGGGSGGHDGTIP